MVRKKTRSELEQAEIRLETLIGKRDALNQDAQLLRKERDMIHEKKGELAAKVRALKERRAAFALEARAHRARRDEFQARAKALIATKRKIRASGHSDVRSELRSMKRKIADMEMRQQTASLSLSEENELIDDLKDSMRRLQELERLKADQDEIAKEVRDLDAGITELFRLADQEHQASLALSAQSRTAHEEMIALARTVFALIQEADQKHAAYLEARKKADEVHAKVVEMREKVLSIKGTHRAEIREARELLRRQNRAVRQALLDPKKLEESADEALRALLQKGKVEIGR